MSNDFLPFHKPDIGEAEIRAVVETLHSGWLTTGHKVKTFEDDFARYVGAKHAVAVNSGTAALHLALDAVSIKQGDEVIVPTMISLDRNFILLRQFGPYQVLERR